MSDLDWIDEQLDKKEEEDYLPIRREQPKQGTLDRRFPAPTVQTRSENCVRKGNDNWSQRELF